MTRLFSTAAAAALLSLQAAPSLAQTSRAETQVQAVVAVTDGCLLSGPAATAGDLKSLGGHGGPGAAIATFGAQVLGDLVSAGAGLLASALEEASRERAFVYSGRSSFDFYRFQQETTAAPDPGSTEGSLASPPTLVAVSPSTGGQCLIIAVPDPAVAAEAARLNIDPPALTDAQIAALAGLPNVRPAERLDGVARDPNAELTGQDAWAALGLPPQPALYLEAELQSRPDGFRVRPVFFWRRAPLPGARNRALPTELHVTFAVPALATDQAPMGTPFAVARIPLPALSPAESSILPAEALRPYASEVLPMRPLAGSPTTALTALTTAQAAATQNQQDIRVAERTEARARVLAAAPDATAAAVAAWRLAQDQLEDNTRARSGLVDRATGLAEEAVGARLGSTNVQARVVLIQDANRFGLALAKAIRDRSPAVGAAITAELTPQSRSEAWTAADTNYVTTMSTVQSKADALARAVAAGDANLVLTARLELQNAQAAANAAAAASDRALPFPNVI